MSEVQDKQKRPTKRDSRAAAATAKAKSGGTGVAARAANRPARAAAAGKPGRERRVAGAVNKRGRPRKVPSAARRQDILDAALAVFAEHGFEAARLDDVAARANVAKGTVYLYFADKEKLFEDVVGSAVAPIVERVTALAAAPDLPADKLLETLFAVFEKEVLGTDRKLVMRLVIAEGPRFPRIAEYYYRNVVGRILPLVAKAAGRAAQRGEMWTDAFARYPQLIAAPLLMAVIWDGLFARIKPLDVAGFLRAHLNVMTGPREGAAP